MGVNSSFDDSNFILEDDNLSYYYGFRSSNSEEDNNKNNADKLDKNNKSNLFLENKLRVPVTFEWNNGGNNVYVTGNFCNWKQFFLMNKGQDGKFYLILNLPKGKYQYKFKVDEEWKFNDKFPIITENGIINNIIDITNYELNEKNIEEYSTTENSSNFTSEHNDISKISKKNLCKTKNYSYLNKKIYSNYIPSKDELKEKIPKLPIQYKSSININLYSNQNNIGNNKFIKIHEKNILSDNISFKKIGIIHHEQINHLNINNNLLKNKGYKNKNIICSISSRYRSKFTTFVYYKPNNNQFY